MRFITQVFQVVLTSQHSLIAAGDAYAASLAVHHYLPGKGVHYIAALGDNRHITGWHQECWKLDILLIPRAHDAITVRAYDGHASPGGSLSYRSL